MLSPLLLSLAIALPTTPQDEARDPVSLVHVELDACSPAQLVALFAPGARLERLESPAADGGVGALAGPRELRRLEDLAIPYEILVEDLVSHYQSRFDPAALGSSTLGATLSPPFGAGSEGGHYSWAQVVSVLDQLSAAHPSIITPKFSLGTSVEGRDLWAVKVSDNPGVDENEPEVRFDSMHHAREPQSMQTTLWFLLFLLENYGADPLATYLVDEREIWFVPVVNPDGYVYNEVNTPGGGGLWRKNRRNNGGGSFGVDPNRNYPYEWGYDDIGSAGDPFEETYRGPSPASEPEVQAMTAFFAARDFKTALSSHSFSGLWLAPFGYDFVPPADDALFDELGALATEVNGYTFGPAPEVLYAANGGTIDTDYGVHGTLSWTPEIGFDADGFWPSTDRIVPLAEENLLGFQRTALAAGAYVRLASTTFDDLGDGDGFFEPGEALAVEALFKNSGLASAGALDASISSASPFVSASGFASLGAVAPGASVDTGPALVLTLDAAAPTGEDIAFEIAFSYDGLPRTESLALTVGEPFLFLVDDLELDVGWTVGAPGDAPDTGEWERGDPIGTDSSGVPASPEDDASDPSTLCFVTGNGGGSGGTDDVDEGPTTLLSPVFDLSQVTAARLEYSRWYALLSTVDDVFEVSISADAGGSWTTLESVAHNENEWKRVVHRVEDYVSLTDQMQVRFVATDVPNNSIVEAAVDDFAVTVYDAAPRLSLYGAAAQGTPIALQVTGPAGAAYGIFYSLGTSSLSIPGVAGDFLLDPGSFFSLLTGTLSAERYDRSVVTVSTAPVLFGQTVYFQSLVVDGGSLLLTNRAATVILP